MAPIRLFQSLTRLLVFASLPGLVIDRQVAMYLMLTIMMTTSVNMLISVVKLVIQSVSIAYRCWSPVGGGCAFVAAFALVLRWCWW